MRMPDRFAGQGAMAVVPGCQFLPLLVWQELFFGFWQRFGLAELLIAVRDLTPDAADHG
jgi:hypothetical protein